MVACSHPGHLPQHVQVLLLWLPNSVYFSASHTFLCFSLPSGKGLRLTGLKSQILSRVLIQFPFSPPALSEFSVGDVSTVWFSLSSCYSLLCQLCLFWHSQLHMESLCPGLKHMQIGHKFGAFRLLKLYFLLSVDMLAFT